MDLREIPQTPTHQSCLAGSRRVPKRSPSWTSSPSRHRPGSPLSPPPAARVGLALDVEFPMPRQGTRKRRSGWDAPTRRACQVSGRESARIVRARPVAPPAATHDRPVSPRCHSRRSAGEPRACPELVERALMEAPPSHTTQARLSLLPQRTRANESRLPPVCHPWPYLNELNPPAASPILNLRRLLVFNNYRIAHIREMRHSD